MAALQIPVGIWKGALDLDVTSVKTSAEYGWIFLGHKNGNIIKLTVDSLHCSLSMLLLGHRSSIVDMAIAVQNSDQQEYASPVLLSLDRNGEVALWSIDDGRCLLHNMMAIDGEARGLHLSPRGEYAFI
jgi:hypothetical protein